MILLVCLRLLYLIVTKLIAWLRLTRHEQSWKSAEIWLLRHQLTVPQRQVHARPKPNWADRALIALLPNVSPRSRRAALRTLGTPAPVRRGHPGALGLPLRCGRPADAGWGRAP